MVSLKINFENKDGKKVLEVDESKKNMIVFDESLKELTKEANVTDQIQSEEEDKDGE